VPRALAYCALAVAGLLWSAFVFIVLLMILLVATGTVKTYAMPNWMMEPTMHCARPAPACEGSHKDRFLVVTRFLDHDRGDIIVHDPNLTPPGADPRLGQFVEVSGPMELWNTKPAGYGEWDPTGLTWDVIGPSTTGGPAGSPGPDGVVGTADDDYALEPWPQFNFLVQGAAPSGVSPSVGTSAPSASATTAPTGREDLTLRLAVGPAGYAAASAGAAVRRHRSPEVAIVRSEVV